MKPKTDVSLLFVVSLGLLLFVWTGIARAGGGIAEPMMTGGQERFVLSGIELPFPVGFLSEGEIAALRNERPEFALRGVEFPFPVGFVPESVMAVYEYEAAIGTGALVEPEWELRGTELPFPVGFVPDRNE